MRLGLIIESHEYMASEPYGRNLIPALHSAGHQLEIRTLKQLIDCPEAFSDDCGDVFCALRMRHSVKYFDSISDLVNGRLLIVQDYDPWAFYEKGSPHLGGYENLVNYTGGMDFYVPNRSWADLIESFPFGSQCVQVHSGRVGPPVSGCRFVTPHDKRAHCNPTFFGSHYPTRARHFDNLEAAGIHVNWRTDKVPYAGFSSLLDSISVWCHDESSTIVAVDGSRVEHEVCRNWLWPKALEVLSRGCILIRDHQPEAVHYGIDKLPAAFLYKDMNEARHMVEHVNGLSNSQRDELGWETVKILQQNDVWSDFASKQIGRMFGK